MIYVLGHDLEPRLRLRLRARPASRYGALAVLFAATAACSFVGARAPKRPLAPSAEYHCKSSAPVADAIASGVAFATALVVIGVERCVDNCNFDPIPIFVGYPAAAVGVIALASGIYGTVVTNRCERMRRRAEVEAARDELLEARANEASELSARAALAAKNNECHVVQEIEPKVRSLDSRVYENVFLRETTIAACLEGAAQQRASCTTERAALYTRLIELDDPAARTELLARIPACEEPPAPPRSTSSSLTEKESLIAYVAVGGARSLDGGHAYSYPAGGDNKTFAVGAGWRVPTLPLWAQASVELGLSRRQDRSSSDSFFRGRVGPESRWCGALHCAIFGIDIGYQRQGADANAKPEFAPAAGLIVGPHLGLDLGMASRFRMLLTFDGYLYRLHTTKAVSGTPEFTDWRRGAGVRLQLAYQLSSRRRPASPAPAPVSAPLPSPWALLKEAAIAATRYNCATVAHLGAQLEELDRELHASLFVKDRKIAACLAR